MATATKKTAAPATEEVLEADNSTNVQDKPEGMKFKSSGVEAERVVLFSIDDEDFTVPKKPGVSVTMQFMNEARKKGEMFAGLALLEALLGEENYEKLLHWDELTEEILGQIMEAAVKLAVGTVEKTSGK